MLLPPKPPSPLQTTNFPQAAMSLEDEIRNVERSLSILHEQLLQCQNQIEHLTELRQKVEQNPSEYFRSAFSCPNSTPLPSPISVHKIVLDSLSSVRENWNLPSTRRHSPSTDQQLPTKVSVKKARRLPGYRVLQRQNLDFARNWKDDEVA